MSGWQFWIDRGGTFTDIVARSPDGRIVTRKLLSDDSEHYQDAALYGIRGILKLPAGEPLAGAIDSVKMGARRSAPMRYWSAKASRLRC